MGKTIFITSFQGLISRILESGILDSLQKSGNIRVVIFVPDFKKEYFLKTFGDRKNVFIEGIDQKNLSKITYMYQRMTFVLLDTKTMRLTRRSFRGYKHYWQFLIAQFVASVFGGRRAIRRLFRVINYYFSGKLIFNQYFDKYKPDLIFSTDIKHILDAQMLIEAKKRRIFTIGMVRSWDYLTGKGITRVIPNKMIVHNETIKEEAKKYADMKEKDIFVSGLPHFDPYVNYKRTEREIFFKKLNIDKSKRILLYAPWGDKFADMDWQFLKMFSDAVKENRLPSDLVLLVRLPPGDTMELKDFKLPSNIIIDSPGVKFGERHRKTNEMNLGDLLHLADSIFYSEVLIAPPSTMVIDSAVFDKPIIIMAFDGYKKKGYYEGVTHYFDFCHIKNLIDTGGSSLAKSENELIELVNKYIKNPKYESEGRKRIIQKQCFKLDGKSSERVANYLLSFLN